MLSYRHSFHAGNPADVIKHLVLKEVLAYLGKKDKPFDYVDTHSGVGLYTLSSDDAQKTQEYLDGIAKLYQADGLSAPVADYVAMVKTFNSDDELAVYPGSPKVAEHYLRKQDKGWLFELHPQDINALKGNFANNRRVNVRFEDGFKGLVGLMPPQSRRGAVLIDPPYEIKTDYQQVVKTVIAAQKRFATGTYMIWYPVVQRERIDEMEQSLKASGIKNIHLYELATEADKVERGMTASGMIVINPPWTLKATMDEVLPELTKLLANSSGFYRSDVLVDE